uniref:NADH-ubiquinone oxidoreductase chain 6 n=1 Tax=Myodermum sp. MYO01 TaxID=1205636 RepID=A0A0S2MS31_9SCAR|nr:NADH deshydrogenase subunit 6 [Myodermum sp. MYO01]
MILTFMLTSLICSLTFMMLSHPLSLGMTLLTQTIIIALSMGLFNLNFWFSYIMFLIMIGGMLVLFIYMTSVASNEKFTFSIKILLMISFTLFLVSLTFFIPKIYTNMTNLYKEMISLDFQYTLSLSKFFNYPSMSIMLLLIIYLLITLIAVVKITNIKQGPLRQMN